MDEQQLDIERRKLALEERRVAVEERQAKQARTTRLSVLIPVVIALVVLGGDVVMQRMNAHDALSLQETQAKDNFELKVAELVMDTKSALGARNRAIAMREIFPNRVGKEFARAFNPEDASSREVRRENQRVEAKKEMLRLLAEHPTARRQIIDTWRRLFPGDEWAQALR